MLKANNAAEFEKSLPSILSVVENMPFAVIALEPKTGEPAYLNKIGEELLANSDHENFFTTLKEAYYIRYVKPYANSLAADYPITRDFNDSPFDLLEPYLRKLDGSLQRLYVKMVPLCGAKGELLYSLALVAENPILLFGQDPSKKRTDFFRKVVANSKDITIIFSASGQEVFVSNACFNILGYLPSEIIEIGGFNLFHPKDRNRIYSEFQELLHKPNKMMRAEHRIRHKNGKWLHFESIAENKLFDRDIQGIVLNQRDITQRRVSEKKILKATKALAQSEKNYKGLYESLRDGLVRVDKRGTIVEANKAFVNMLGYDSVDELKVNYKDITPQKYHEFEQELIETQILPRGYSDEYEKELIKKDGSTIPVKVKIWLIKKGEIYKGGWGIIRDISEKKQAERGLLQSAVQLADSEAKYHGLFESSKDAIVKVDMDGNILEANKAYVKMLGYDSIDELKSTYQEITPKKWHAFEQNIVETQIIPRGYSDDYEKEYIRKDGTVFPVSDKTWLITKDGKPVGMWAIMRDISGKKQAEKQILQATKALAESESNYRGLFESIKDGIVKVDMDGNIIEANHAYLKMLGYQSTKELKRNYRELTPSDWHDFEQNIVETQVIQRGYSDEFEKEYIRKDGSVFPISIKTWLIRNNGEPLGMWAIIRDVSEKKQAERQILEATRALAESESKYRGLFESLKDGIVKTDMDGNILEANCAYLKMLGYQSTKELKKTYREFTPKKWHDFEQNIVETQVFQRGFSDEYEKEYIRKDGSVFPISLKIWLITNEGKPVGMWGIIRDITESKNAENLFKEMHDKLEKLNKKEHLVREQERISLASAIHDELGQAMTAIKFDLGWLLEKTKHQKQIRQKLESLLQLTQNTLEQVQRISSEIRPCLLDEKGLKEALKRFSNDFSLRTGIKCHLKVEKLPGINRQLELALYRIVQESLTNVARHSKATKVTIDLKKTKENILICVSDNGIGINTDTGKLTKSLGIKGMRERTAYFNGKLEIENSLGTTVKVTIPLVEALLFDLARD